MLFSNSDNIELNESVTSEWRIGKDVEENGRGIIKGTIAVFAWRD
jgi:hypothetical protein